MQLNNNFILSLHCIFSNTSNLFIMMFPNMTSYSFLMTFELLKDCILTAKLTECLKESKSIPGSINNSYSILLSAVGMLLLIYSMLQWGKKNPSCFINAFLLLDKAGHMFL